MFPANLARIIVSVNFTFLILVALPLGVYLLFILFQTLEIGAPEGETGLAQHHVEADSPKSASERTTSPFGTDNLSATSATTRIAALDSTPTLAPVPLPVAELAEDSDTSLDQKQVTDASQGHAEPSARLSEAVTSLSPNTPSPDEALSTRVTDSPELPATTIESPAADVSTADISSAAPGPEVVTKPSEPDDPILPEGPLEIARKGSPKYAFDYRGRLWIDKKNKGFFRQLRRPRLPPDEPTG